MVWVYNIYVIKESRTPQTEKERGTMKELKSKMGAYYETKQALSEAEYRAIVAITEVVAESGGAFCGDIAEATGIPSCVVSGMMRKAYHRGHINCRGHRRRTKTYVRLNADGSVNTNDTLTVGYDACYYT